MSYWQHDWQRQLEDGVLVEWAEVRQREEADGGHQVDLEIDSISRFKRRRYSLIVKYSRTFVSSSINDIVVME